MLYCSSMNDDYTLSAARPPVDFTPPDWHEDRDEGQLAVDVLETAAEMLVVSTMAGARSDRIEVFVHNDLLTIRGERQSPLVGEAVIHSYCGECKGLQSFNM